MVETGPPRATRPALLRQSGRHQVLRLDLADADQHVHAAMQAHLARRLIAQKFRARHARIDQRPILGLLPTGAVLLLPESGAPRLEPRDFIVGDLE